jgi:hypothetical protein
MLKGLIAFLSALPDIIRFITKLQKDYQIKQDIKAINKAFEEKNAEALNDIFKR